jgi:hypothetical protein
MEHNDLFCNFIIVFESKTRYVKLGDVSALALLQSEGDGKYKVCVLPQRLQAAVRHTKADKMDYSTTKEYVLQQDMLQHSRGLSALPRHSKMSAPDPPTCDVSHVKKVTKSGTRKPPVICFLCDEPGHIKEYCPVRLEVLAQKKRQLKKSKKPISESSDEDDHDIDNDADDSQVSAGEESDASTEVSVRKTPSVRKSFHRVRSISPILNIPASRFGL